MAGNYPDVPAPRIAYDRDGTVGVHLVTNTGTVQQATLTDMQRMNDEDADYADNYAWYGNIGGVQYGMAFVFPQLMDISGYLVQAVIAGATLGGLQTSVDTTNGLDGTWVTVDPSWTNSYGGISIEIMRNNIVATAITQVKAVRLLTNMGTGGSRAIRFYAIHFYGAVSVGETPDRLRVWHPTLDQPLDDNSTASGAYFDWGNVQRDTVPSDRQFRIKNDSLTLTANSVTISQQAPTDTSPLVASQYTFSDGGAFASSLNIGNLAPGVISSVISKRFSPPANAALSLWTSRTVIDAGSWS